MAFRSAPRENDWSVRLEAFPERSPRAYRASLLDPYKPSILERWQAGCWNGSQLYAEVKTRGYTASVALFRLFISRVRKQHRATGTATKLELSADGTQVSGPADPVPKPCIKRRLSPARARLSLRESSWEAG